MNHLQPATTPCEIHVYYVSGSTGILAESMGHALLSQFPDIRFNVEKIPFIHTPDEARCALIRILQQSDGTQPLVFCTIMDKETRDVFNCPEVRFFDVFLNTLDLVEQSLGIQAQRKPGNSRHYTTSRMDKRVDAIHFSLEHDDGTKPADYDEAEIIFVGVSRSGKTPVSIYLATHMELKSANFPLTADHLDKYELPKEIVRNRKRAVGLTCSPQYLHTIREKRYAGSTYASLKNCIKELQQAKQLYLRHNIKILNVEGRSIEEIAVQAIQAIGLAKTGQQKARTRTRSSV